MKEFKIALIQLLVSANKQENIKRACDFISIAAKNDAKIISLPVISSFFLNKIEPKSQLYFI